MKEERRGRGVKKLNFNSWIGLLYCFTLHNGREDFQLVKIMTNLFKMLTFQSFILSKLQEGKLKWTDVSRKMIF